MKIEKFEDSIAWQKSQALCKNLYGIFIFSKDFGFRDQILRAAVSISNNIAEGFERRTDKEFRQFLSISKGSCGEVRSMLYLALDLNYINKDSFKINSGLAIEISKMLSVFISKL